MNVNTPQSPLSPHTAASSGAESVSGAGCHGHILPLQTGHVGLQADQEVVLGHLQNQEGECQERRAQEVTDL